jgi:hypothetical protein
MDSMNIGGRKLGVLLPRIHKSANSSLSFVLTTRFEVQNAVIVQVQNPGSFNRSSRAQHLSFNMGAHQ